MSWNQIKISSWKELVEIIDFTKSYQSTLSPWIFRGQSNEEWSLKTTILRKILFHNINKKTALGIEKRLYREFKTKYRLYCNHKIPKFEEFDTFCYLGMMQHYCCPTRLLDWTESPYIATFFTIESLFDKNGILYILNASKLEFKVTDKFGEFSKLTEEDVLGNSDNGAIYPVLNLFQTDRNIHQRGLFTISPNIMEDHEILIDNIFSEKEKIEYCTKVIIPYNLKLEFLARLRSMNITYDNLFQNLDGLGRSLGHIADLRGWKNN
jgi:hypothetical protein